MRGSETARVWERRFLQRKALFPASRDTTSSGPRPLSHVQTSSEQSDRTSRTKAAVTLGDEQVTGLRSRQREGTASPHRPQLTPTRCHKQPQQQQVTREQTQSLKKQHLRGPGLRNHFPSGL